MWPDSSKDNFKDCSYSDFTKDEGVRCQKSINLSFGCVTIIWSTACLCLGWISLVRRGVYLQLTSFILAFSLALTSGTVFYLILPSCLENRQYLVKEHATLRHAGSIMSACVWFFFIFDRLGNFFFARKVLNTHELEIDENHNRKSQLRNSMMARDDMIQLESQIQQSSRITQSGGHLYYQSNRMSKRFTGRTTFLTNATGATGISMASATTGITQLSELVRSGQIRIPSKKDTTLKGLFDISAMGLLMASSNLIGMFILGLTMTSTMNFSVAEGICVTITLFFHEITQKLSDYIHYQEHGLNPFHALIWNAATSLTIYGGCALGIVVENSYSSEWLFTMAAGFMLYSAFGITMPQLEQSEALLIASNFSPGKAFAIQNFGMFCGYAFCAFMAYEEFEDSALEW